MGITVEEADAVFSIPVGMPKTGVFGLLDLIGIDLMPLIAKSFMATLPADDAYRAANIEHPLVTKMIADGYTGRKGKGGFYRMNKSPDGAKVKESIDLKTGEYRASNKVKLAAVENAGKDLRALVSTDDKIGQYAWTVLSQALVYAASLVPQIADDIVAVDTAMRLGFNWKFGPFELIDKLGAKWFADQLTTQGRPVPDMLAKAAQSSFYRVEGGRLEYLATDGTFKTVTRGEGILLLSDIKRNAKPVLKNGSASLWDIGDGVLCLEFTSKMNAIDPDTLGMVKKSVTFISESKGNYKGLVVHNEGENFSVGANLGLALFALNIAMYPAIDDLVKTGQDSYHMLRFAPFPSVAAPSGMALGGGCEITLHCSAVQAHAETYIGLVEVGVGIVPGWGGCAQMLGRAFANKKRFGGPIPPVSGVFETVSVAKVAKSAFDAQDIGYMRPTDGITMNRDRLLFDAKQKVLELAKDYKPPEPYVYNLPGWSGRAALSLAVEGFRLLGKAMPHDVTVSKALATVLCGGENDVTSQVTEQQIMDMERREFMRLIHTPETMARIEHMLKTGKPLRN